MVLLLCFFFFRHSQTQNTSFRALLDTGNEYRQKDGFSRCESHHDTVSNYGSEQRNIFQTKVSHISKRDFKIFVFNLNIYRKHDLQIND